jgi:hypothetical protein
MRFILILLLSVLVVACKTENEVVDLGYNYFPTHVGATWVYHVDSFGYDDNSGTTKIDTFAYEYKEQITGVYIDVNGKTAQIVDRFYKMADTMPWQKVNSSQILRTELNAQKVQENVRYVKLVFPLEKYKKWDGNLYNSLGEEFYECTSFDEAATVGNIPYSQTLTVQQVDELNAIEEIKRTEIYARNIGLVYFLSDSLNTQTDFNVNPPVEKTRGFRYRLTLKSFTP